MAESPVATEAHGKHAVLGVNHQTVVDAPGDAQELAYVLSVESLVVFILVEEDLEVDFSGVVRVGLHLEVHAKGLGDILDALVEAQLAPGDAAPDPEVCGFGEGGGVESRSGDLADLLVGLAATLKVQLSWFVQMDHFLSNAKLTLQPLSECINLAFLVQQHSMGETCLYLHEVKALFAANHRLFLVCFILMLLLECLESLFGDRLPIHLNKVEAKHTDLRNHA